MATYVKSSTKPQGRVNNVKLTCPTCHMKSFMDPSALARASGWRCCYCEKQHTK